MHLYEQLNLCSTHTWPVADAHPYACTCRPLLETANSPSPLSLHVARAIAVLDGPLAGAESMSTLMIPPGSQGVDNDQPIQGLLLSPSALVSPSNK